MSPDGLDDSGNRSRRPLFVRGMVTVLAGVSVVSLLMLTGDDTTPLAEPAVPTTSTSTTTTTVALTDTLRGVLPDANGRLVAAVGVGPIELVSWPGTGLKTTAPIPMWPRPEIEFDRSGRYMAFLGPAAAGADSALYVGSTSAWHPLAVHANSFRWHARDAGRVAWTGDGLLCHGQVHPDGGFTSLRCLLDVEGSLLGFDDIGYLLATGPGVIVRRDLEGAELGRTEGNTASIGSDGRILIVGAESTSADSRFSVAEPDLARVTRLDWVPAGAVAEDGFTAWSPAASPPQLAFLVPLSDDTWQLQQWSISGRLLASSNLEGRYWNVEWGWLGRYVLSAGVNDRGDHVIDVYDTDSRQHFILEMTGRVQDIHFVRDPDAPIRFDLTSVLKGSPVK